MLAILSLALYGPESLFSLPPQHLFVHLYSFLYWRSLCFKDNSTSRGGWICMDAHSRSNISCLHGRLPYWKLFMSSPGQLQARAAPVVVTGQLVSYRRRVTEAVWDSSFQSPLAQHKCWSQISLVHLSI